MLTGDKLETAENIGYLCSLINKETKVFRIKSADIPTLTYKSFIINIYLNNTYIDIQYYFRALFEKIHMKISEFRKGGGYSQNDHIKEVREITNYFGREEEKKNDYISSANKIEMASHNASFARKPSLSHNAPGAVFPEREREGSFLDFKTFALVIEGDVISHVFNSPKYIQDFLKIIPECRYFTLILIKLYVLL